uniref:Uncharacterized protein n=1 Tax=Knipowitschia caucasica TaxID=637954 RepID=A0AAV2K7T1_KNICA
MSRLVQAFPSLFIQSVLYRHNQRCCSESRWRRLIIIIIGVEIVILLNRADKIELEVSRSMDVSGVGYDMFLEAVLGNFVRHSQIGKRSDHRATL